MNLEDHAEADRAEMQRLAAGHDSALNVLMERHSDRLFRFLVRQLQNETEAADLAEECFVRVYQNRQRFEPRYKFTSWLYAIAANLVRDRYRWRSRHPEVPGDAAESDHETGWLEQLPDSRSGPGDTLEQTERVRAIQRAVGELAEELKTPLILAEYEGLSHAEIAEVLGCSSKAVEMRIYRALQQLKKSLVGLLSEV